MAKLQGLLPLPMTDHWVVGGWGGGGTGARPVVPAVPGGTAL